MCSKSKKKSEEFVGGDGPAMSAAVRKGPWTEEEDAQLGLRRTGKSCRLRWVNYLHPGLRRGRITADEERQILQLHAQWGSRWSRIARSLPGRTDNEIKNYWRTRMRKKALEERRKSAGTGAGNAAKNTAAEASESSSVTTTSGCSSGSPNCSATATSTSSPAAESSALRESSGDEADADADAEETSAATAASHQHQYQQAPPPPPPPPPQEYFSTMDQLWNEIAAAEAVASYVDSWEAGHGAAAAAAAMEPSMPASPVWEFCSDYSLWRIDDEEYYKKMLDAS
ncbi:hypothetical protein ACP4OV_015819 [Aristida adscensionis]